MGITPNDFEMKHSGPGSPGLNKYSKATIKERRICRLSLVTNFQKLNLQ